MYIIMYVVLALCSMPVCRCVCMSVCIYSVCMYVFTYVCMCVYIYSISACVLMHTHVSMCVCRYVYLHFLFFYLFYVYVCLWLYACVWALIERILETYPKRIERGCQTDAPYPTKRMVLGRFSSNCKVTMIYGRLTFQPPALGYIRRPKQHVSSFLRIRLAVDLNNAWSCGGC